MRNIFFCVVGILFSGLVGAQSTNESIASMFSKSPPSFCSSGKSTQGVTIGATCNAYGDSCSFDWSSFFDSFSYLEAETSKYQILNETITVKGDGRWGVDRGERVHFFDSIGGYRGSDKANSDGNAYKSYQATYTQTPDGPTQVWVMRWSMSGMPSPTINYQQQMINQQYLDQYGITDGRYIPSVGDSTNYGSFVGSYYCSKKEVVFQHRPHLSLSGLSSPFTITGGGMSTRFPYGFPLYYEVDQNSKAVRENVQVKVTLYARYSNSSRLDIVGTKYESQQRGVVSISPSGYSVSNGTVKFYAEIEDGTYSSGEIHIGNFTYVASMPSACAQACPASMGSYRSQCQGSSSACNYRAW